LSVFTIDNPEANKFILSLEGPSYSGISTIQFDSHDIAHLLQEQNPHKASGPDVISARFIKETSIHIAPALALIFNASLTQGKLPRD